MVSGASTQWNRYSLGLEADDPVSAGDECGHVRRSRPRPVQCGEVVVGRPTGNGTTLSNVNEHRSFHRFRDEVAQRWQPDPFDAIAHIGTHDLCRITHKDETGGLV